MSCPIFLSDLSEADAVMILCAPKVSSRLGGRVGTDVRVTLLCKRTYKVTGSRAEYIVRFPMADADLSMLKKEERVQGGLRDRVSLLIPDTQVIDDLDGYPAFAIHKMIPGQALTSGCYADLSPEARERLVMDLVNFFYETHSIPLAVACEWLGIPFERKGTVAKLASTRGKPIWFGPEAVAEMRVRLHGLLDVHQTTLFEDTVRLFEALGTDPNNMVFGHGDMHGFNMAIGEDHLGPRLVGVFDLGCTGILDVHEDFFRLSLISEDLLDRVIEAYQVRPGQMRSLQRDRIAIYYRAFLFYLMAERSGKGSDHLKALLESHVEFYAATYGSL